ncbi:ABC transporter permease [Synoicihabitans lomoniglobus]|uniref:ABC transporter permease n=1 Tax=Synoicihabitans lomoniglobus TaxID=2909285 RepID=A0AAF0A073_9BACT|nr:ABC transporter permease [Opitutaceae bacterium LMO-M01]WED64042.1 ABC transporter permease [Opitutaceae bacterium LMO-M01]
MSASVAKPSRQRSPVWWPAIGLLILIAVNAVFDPGFLKMTIVDGHLYGTPIDLFNQGSRVMLLALGMTLVIATGGVDLSVGSVVAVSAAVCAQLIVRETALPLVVLAALGTGLAAGGINAVLVARIGVQPIVATLILMVAGRGLAQLITGGNVVIFSDASFEFLAKGHVLGLPVAALLVLALFGIAQLALRRTAAGLFLEAVGDNATASRFAGIAAARTKALAYLACGGCAGLCGALVAAHIAAADPYQAGINMELDAIFAVVIGGTALTGGRFYLLGSLIGALFLQALTLSMFYFGVPPAVAPVPKAVLIIAVALIQVPRLRQKLTALWQRSPANRKATS